MRRAPLIWYFDSTANAFTDLTRSLGQGTPYGSPLSAVTLNPGDKLYIGTDDWLSGLFLLINNNPPAGPVTIDPETWDGDIEQWVPLPARERFDDLQTGFAWVNPGYNYLTSGVVEWVTGGDILWTRRQADINSNFPEQVVPPSTYIAGMAYYWVRLNNLGTTPLSLDRLLPVYYNTYATARTVAGYVGVRDFNELDVPILTTIRERIRAEEDILDDYMRKTYRLGMAIHERHEFNAYGTKLGNWPIITMTEVGIWTGTTFQSLYLGRNQDYYFDPDMGMVYYTRISLGRGLPWSRAASRYLRQPAAALYTYIYGADFDLVKRRGIVRNIINKRVAASLAVIQDEIVYFVTNPDVLTKPEKVEEWTRTSEEEAMQLRGLVIA